MASVTSCVAGMPDQYPLIALWARKADTHAENSSMGGSWIRRIFGGGVGKHITHTTTQYFEHSENTLRWQQHYRYHKLIL